MRSQFGRFAGSDFKQRLMTDSTASPPVSCGVHFPINFSFD